MKKKNLLVMLGVALLAQAQAADNSNNKDNMKQMPGMRPVTVYEMGANADAWNVDIYAAFTYWNGGFPGMTLATVERSTTSKPILLPKVTTQPGFIVGLGFMAPETAVNFNAQYTWYYNATNKKNTVQKSGVLTDAAEYPNTYTTAGGSLTNTFNRIDAVMNKDLIFSEYFCVAPGGGFVANWGNNYLYTKYSVPSESDADATATEITQNSEKQWGVGPYFQLTSNFVMPSEMMGDWSRLVFFMKGGLGFNWMDQKLNYSDVDTLNDSSIISYANFNSIAPFVDGNMGVRWEMTGSENEYGNFSAEIAWSVQQWFNYTNVYDQYVPSDFFLQGLTAGLGVSF